jgi:hypothetical protein
VVQKRDRDLVLATHGRGIWIIDDLTPLRALTPAMLQQEHRSSSASTHSAAGPKAMPAMRVRMRPTTR